MDMSPEQQRTWDGLIRVADGREFEPGMAERLCRRIESAVLGLGPDVPDLWLSKDRLGDLARCRGLFDASLSGERPAFEMSFKAASGLLLHKAIEIQVGSREEVDPWTLADRSAFRLGEDRGFGPFWQALGPGAQDELLMEAVRRIELFRASFPPMPAARRRLAPVTEFPLRTEFAQGRVTVAGRVDLVLHRPRADRATRVLVDLKSGRAWSGYPEDMRLYALLYTVRTGVPPARVATWFLESGNWQAEEVDEELLAHAADRVIGAVQAATELAGGRVPALTPGPHCSWCPRRSACPAAQGRVA